MTIEKSQLSTSNIVDKDKETNEAIDKMLLSQSKPNTGEDLPVYSLVVKSNQTKRPKSTPYMDWRGHVSRPTTAQTRSR